MKKDSERCAESPALLQSLEQALAQVPDQRSARGLRYQLLPLLMLVMLAKLADADTPLAIADWAAERVEWLREHLQVNWRRMPHHSTFRRLLQRSLSLPELRQSGRAPVAFARLAGSVHGDFPQVALPMPPVRTPFLQGGSQPYQRLDAAHDYSGFAE